MKRIGACSFIFLALAACPGSLENPDRFARADGGMNMMPACALELDVEVDIFAMKCSGDICHGGGAANPPSGGIDLVTMGVADRLLDMPAVGCMQQPLVDTATPSNSVMLTRVRGAGACGSAMPLGTSGLSAGEIECIEAWIAEKIETSTTTGMN